jgi:hypothetical protein
LIASASRTALCNYATAFEGTYQYSADNVLQGGTWGNPTAVYAPRFVRFNFTLIF